MLTKGLFITLEGGEGAGKSTLQEHLAAKFKDLGFDVLKTREPGGSKLGEYIREWLLNRDSSIHIGLKAELLLFLAARAEHIEEMIKPALIKGKVVICDRFNDSTIAYQGAGRGLGVDYVKKLCHLTCGEIEPQLTFFLDVDPQIGLTRTRSENKENSSKGELDRIESEAFAFHALVREGFHLIAQHEPKRFIMIDANAPKQEVFLAAIKAIENFLCV